MRTRVVALGIVVMLVACAGGLYLVLREDHRYTIGELSCASDSSQATAIDLQAVPTWNSPQAALRGALAIHADVGSEISSEGWTLDEIVTGAARWERRNDGHLVAVVEFPRRGNVWSFSSIERCVDP